MTIEEAIRIAQGLITDFKCESETMVEFCNVVIKALKKEPCEDAISRQATIEAFQMFRGYEANRTNAEWVDRIETIVKKLPSANPQAETGHWIDKDEKSAVCSCCNRNNTLYGDFCKWCGAKMVEKQEGSDKE